MRLTLATSLLYTIVLWSTSSSTTLLSLLKSEETVFSLPQFFCSTSVLKQAKSNFVAKLRISTSVAPFKSAFFFLHNLINPI